MLPGLASGEHLGTCATMVDRLGEGATLTPLRPAPPAIEDQLPMCAEVRGGLLSRGACLLKITLLPARVRGVMPQFASSHRATVALPSGRTLTIGGCEPLGEACRLTGGFAHYQFFAQSVGFQLGKIKTHLEAGDRSNAKVYQEFASLFSRDAGGALHSFDALTFDQVVRHSVSCRHWVCPECTNPRTPPPPSPAVAIGSQHAFTATPGSLSRLGAVRASHMLTSETAEEARARQPPRVGTCEQTDLGGDCQSGTLGAWELRVASRRDGLAACRARCHACARCRYVSFSHENADCSWFADCDLDALMTLPELPKANGRSYRTIRVKAGPLPPPKYDPCAGLDYVPAPELPPPSERSDLAQLTTIFVSASPRPSWCNVTAPLTRGSLLWAFLAIPVAPLLPVQP